MDPGVFLNPRRNFCLVGHNGRQSLRFFNPLGDFLFGNRAVRQILGGIDLSHLFGEVLRDAVREFLHRINTGRFQQFGVLRTNAVDTS